MTTLMSQVPKNKLKMINLSKIPMDKSIFDQRSL